MVNNCKHFVEPFLNGSFSELEKPSEYLIKKYKLYQCSKCHKWFSFLGSRI